MRANICDRRHDVGCSYNDSTWLTNANNMHVSRGSVGNGNNGNIALLEANVGRGGTRSSLFFGGVSSLRNTKFAVITVQVNLKV